MARPKDIAAVDLMMSIPTGTGKPMPPGFHAPVRVVPEPGGEKGLIGYMFKDADARKDDAADPAKVIAEMDEHNVAVAQIRIHGHDPEGALALFEEHPTRFIGDVWVDPNQGMDAVRELEATVRLHPNVKSVTVTASFINPQVPLDDKKWYPIYAKCCELGVPINVFVGVPGPRVPYKGQHPGLLDEIAWFFPELKIVMRHGGEPWTALCCKLMLKWPNVFYCTSAFAPQYYPRDVLDFANKRGREKVMFSGYYPSLAYDRTFAELDDLPLREETWKPFLRDNAVRVYGLEDVLGA